MRELVISSTVVVGITVPAMVLLTLVVNWVAEQRQHLAYAGWKITLIDLSTGKVLEKKFDDVLEMERALPTPPGRQQLYLAADLTVSRQQCCLLARPEGVWLQNLSAVNISLLNGVPAESPMLLTVGDHLCLGAHEYLLSALIPV